MIPFNRATLVGRELEYMQAALAAGHISGNGAFTQRCQTLLEREVGVNKALLTTSCTHALEMAAMLLDVAPGEEIIIPAFTFVSTANAFVLHGAKPVFGDIRPDTLNLDERRLEGLISRKTRAIVVVHYGGVACEMDGIAEVANRHGIPIIEDNAHGLFGRYKGRQLGTFGAMATLSFHETKNFTCGEGGALLLNDGDLLARAEILREKGTNRSSFFRGETDKYTWVDVGSSYIPSELLAGFLLAQLEQRDQIQATRRRIFENYQTGLAHWADRNGVQLPYIPESCESSYHLFYLLLPDLASRQRFISSLKEKGVLSVFHYVPLHASPMGKQLGGAERQCPVSEQISDRLVRLPFFNGLTPDDQQKVMEAAVAFSP